MELGENFISDNVEMNSKQASQDPLHYRHFLIRRLNSLFLKSHRL